MISSCRPPAPPLTGLAQPHSLATDTQDLLQHTELHDAIEYTVDHNTVPGKREDLETYTFILQASMQSIAPAPSPQQVRVSFYVSVSPSTAPPYSPAYPLLFLLVVVTGIHFTWKMSS